MPTVPFNQRIDAFDGDSQRPYREKVVDISGRLDGLILALEAHPLFNHADVPTTPKALFWIWDFIKNTRHMLTQISIPALEAGDQATVGAWGNVIGRNQLSFLLITDTTGNTNAMLTAEHPPIDFGTTVKEKAGRL